MSKSTKRKTTTKAATRICTMKKWGIISWIAVSVLTITLIVCVFGFPDIEPESLATITGLAWAELSVYNACYAFKERAENKLKIAYGFIEKMTETYGIEEITPILQSIIGE